MPPGAGMSPLPLPPAPGAVCCAGQCPNCLVEVDGWPGVPGLHRARATGDGRQAYEREPLAGVRCDEGHRPGRRRLTPPGFYYKTFIRPRRLWPLYERVLRHAAGLGKLPKKQAEREWQTEYRRRHAADVLVIGGGIAGMAAALQAAELGADVVLVDDGPSWAGWLSPTSRRRGRSSPRGFAPPGWRFSRRRPRSAGSTGSSRSGAAARCIRSGPAPTSPRPARSSSPWCSRATTSPG